MSEVTRNTVFNIRGNNPMPPIGETVVVTKAASATGGEVAKVEYNGESIGAISIANGNRNGVKILLPNTTALSRDDMAKMPATWTAKVVDKGTINHGQPKDAIAIEYVAPWNKTSGNRAPQQGDVTLTFKVQGATSQNPGKAKVIAALNQGDDAFLSMSIETKNGEEQVVMSLNGDKAGFIAPASAANESDYTMLLELLNSGVALEGKAFGQTATSYQVKILVSGKAAAQAAANAAKAANNSEKQRIVDEQICSQDLLERIETYCLDCGLTSKQVGKIFATYKKYPDAVQFRIVTQPQTMYKDTHGYIEEAVCSILAGQALVFSGEAGSGKNCAMETLAWIFQRPLYDFSINNQTDKYDLQGSKTIEAEETDAGNVIQKVSYQPELLLEALEVGGFYNTDELNFADAGITGILHSIADGRRYSEVAGYRRVVADPNFQLLATMNIAYAGTNELNAALDSRYDEIVFEMPDSIADILETACPYASKRDISTCDKIYKKILAANRDATLDMQVSSRNFIKALAKVEQGLSLKRALNMNLTNKLRDADYKKAMSELIEMNCPN